MTSPPKGPAADSVESRLQRTRTVRYGHKIVRAYVRHHHDLTLLNPTPLPPTGPAILVCNHISGLDPILLQSTTNRLITWMMAREYYEVKAFRWFYESIGAIPVERTGKDLSAMRGAFRALEQGRVIGLFPEGRISPTSDVLPFQTGVGLLAIRSGAPVYPAFLTGTARGTEMVESFIIPQRVALRFGKSLVADRKDPIKSDLLHLTQIIQKSVVALGERADFTVDNLSKAAEGLSFPAI